MTETATAATDTADAGEGSTNGEAKGTKLFEYTVSVDGKPHTMTFQPLNKIPAGVLRHARGDPEAQLWGPFEWALSFDDLEVLDTVPVDELPKILEAWQAHSEIELGELLGSSNSPATSATAKRSRRTSSRSG